MITLIFVVIAATFVVETAFMQVSSAQRAVDAGVKLPLDVRCVTYFWLVIGVCADIVFNLTRGSLIFRELPHELLFTDRVKRHARKSDGWRKGKADEWAAFLNAVDPGHVE